MMNQGMMGQGMMAGQWMGGGQMMGQDMTRQNMMAQRRSMEKLMNELLENQTAMEKTRSLRALGPLLKKHRSLLEQLRDEMSRSWGMPGPRMNKRMGRRSSTARTGQAESASPPESSLAATGQTIFEAQGCSACHGAGGVGTARAPSLVDIGKKFSSTQLDDLIRHPRSTKMPSYPLPDTEMKAFIAYPQSLR